MVVLAADEVPPMGDDDALLDDLLAALRRYVVLPDEDSAIAVTLWIAATHALPAFECAPRLVVSSPQKRCGKTRLLDVVHGTCHKPLATVDATIAAIFRSLGGDHPPTLIIDEADAIFGSKKAAENNEDLRKLLNAGHQRGKPAIRCVGPLQIPTAFNVFAMAALAGIGGMPDTITDRAVNITLRRRLVTEKVAQFRSRRDGPKLAALRDRLAAWAAPRREVLAKAEPAMPVTDRAADTWEPLIAIADAVGGDWPMKARMACTVLVAAAVEADEDDELGIKLLAYPGHIRDDANRDVHAVSAPSGRTQPPRILPVERLRAHRPQTRLPAQRVRNHATAQRRQSRARLPSRGAAGRLCPVPSGISVRPVRPVRHAV